MLILAYPLDKSPDLKHSLWKTSILPYSLLFASLSATLYSWCLVSMGPHRVCEFNRGFIRGPPLVWHLLPLWRKQTSQNIPNSHQTNRYGISDLPKPLFFPSVRLVIVLAFNFLGESEGTDRAPTSANDVIAPLMTILWNLGSWHPQKRC